MKGSKRRPLSLEVTQEQFESNWNRIFSNKKPCGVEAMESGNLVCTNCGKEAQKEEFRCENKKLKKVVYVSTRSLIA